MSDPRIPPGYEIVTTPPPAGVPKGYEVVETPTATGGQGYAGPEPTASGIAPPPPEKSVLDRVINTGMNILPSAGHAVEGIFNAVTDPVGTGAAIGSIVQGGLSKLGVSSDEEVAKAKLQLEHLKTLDPDKPVMIPGLGMVIPKNIIPTMEHKASQNSTERVAARKEIEKNFEVMKDFYADRYGSMDGFLKAVEEDPVGVLLDASTVLTGVGGVARGAGAATARVGASTSSRALTKAGEVASKAGAAIDPIQQSLNFGTWAATKGIPTAAKEYVGLASGAGPDAFSEAFRVAKERAMDPSNVSAAEAYKRLADAMDGVRTPEQTVALANEGIQTMKTDASRAFEFRKNNPTDGWYHDATTLKTQPVRDAWNEVYKTMFGKNGEPVVPLDQLKKIEAIGDQIAKWEMGDPAGHTLGGFDDLKRTIENSRGGIDDRQLNRVVTALTKEAKSIANKQSDVIYAGKPENLYRRSQEGYSKTMSELEELEKSLGVGSKQSSIDSAARKLTSVMRNNVNTNFGQRLKNVETLETQGHVDLMPEIAGHALNTWAPRGITGKILGAGLTMFPGLMASLPAASPKLMGHVARKLGTAAGMLDDPMKSAAVAADAIKRAGAPVGGQLSHIGQGDYTYGPQARGGYLRNVR